MFLTSSRPSSVNSIPSWLRDLAFTPTPSPALRSDLHSPIPCLVGPRQHPGAGAGEGALPPDKFTAALISPEAPAGDLGRGLGVRPLAPSLPGPRAGKAGSTHRQVSPPGEVCSLGPDPRGCRGAEGSRKSMPLVLPCAPTLL